MNEQLTIRGYLATLPKQVVMTTPSKEIMAAAPDTLPKKPGTWGQAVSNLRSQYRGGGKKAKKMMVLGGNPPSDALIRERVKMAVAREIQAIADEAKRVEAEWQTILGE